MSSLFLIKINDLDQHDMPLVQVYFGVDFPPLLHHDCKQHGHLDLCIDYNCQNSYKVDSFGKRVMVVELVHLEPKTDQQ